MKYDNSCFLFDILSLGLSQLYISQRKLTNVSLWFQSNNFSNFAPIRVRCFDDSAKLIITDGHSRAFAAWKAGLKQIPVSMDNDIIYEDEETIFQYKECIAWCNRFQLHNIACLADRVLSQNDYKLLWDKRCDKLHYLSNAIFSHKISSELLLTIKEQFARKKLFLYGTSEDLSIFYFENELGKTHSIEGAIII